jgi:hypothetical protein
MRGTRAKRIRKISMAIMQKEVRRGRKFTQTSFMRFYRRMKKAWKRRRVTVKLAGLGSPTVNVRG